jgi:single-stranded-DNA-specific exonuclease
VKRRWLVNKTNKDFLEYLSRNASISTAFAQILVNRGLKDTDTIKNFLNPSFDNLHDPFQIPDMERAVQRLKSAVEKGETILVHGDYDADGITATALLVSALNSLGLNTRYYIPNRITDGYGFSREGIRRAEKLGATLILTVDCGINSTEEVSLASSLGIDVIITDHHRPPQKLPEALAIINPHRFDSEYPFKDLAGVGVAFKLVHALFRDSHTTINDSQLSTLLEFVAVGTIGDSVPLTGENRILVQYGLKALNNSRSPWIEALKETAGVNRQDMRSGLFSYTLIPRINAIGRLGDAHEVVEFFLTRDELKAKETASLLEEQNRKRQKIEESVYRSALGMLDAEHLDGAIVLHSPEWHPGVLGIVASRFVERFYRPTFLFSIKDSVAKGSARSIPSFNLYEGICKCDTMLLGYGGHSQAAGIRIHVDNIPEFKQAIISVIENTFNRDDMTPTVEIDAGIELFEVNFNLIKELTLLEPFGIANQAPLLGAKGVEMISPRIVGNKHLKMKSKQKSISIDTIGFAMANHLELADSSSKVDIAFVPRMNEWNGNKTLQLNLKALRPSV